MITDQLTADNIDEAVMCRGIDPEDTLRRIAREWLSHRQKCTCGQHEACSVCEIDYLLDEAFRLPEH